MQRFGKVIEFDAPDGWAETAEGNRLRFDGPAGQVLIVSGTVIEGEAAPEALDSARARLLEVMLATMRQAADDPDLVVIQKLHRVDHALPCHTLGARTLDGACLFYQAAVEHERGVLFATYEAALDAGEVGRFDAFLRSVRLLGAPGPRPAPAPRRDRRQHTDTDPELEGLRLLLRKGQQESMQATLRRRAPAPSAVSSLEDARHRLAGYVNRHPDRAEAWRLLSLAEESLLDYADALQHLEHAASLDGSPRSDLKRLAALREAAGFWDGLGLSPRQLADLGTHLERMQPGEGCGHDLTLTRAWCDAVGIPCVGDVLEALRERGGACDCRVLANVVH